MGFNNRLNIYQLVLLALLIIETAEVYIKMNMDSILSLSFMILEKEI